MTNKYEPFLGKIIHAPDLDLLPSIHQDVVIDSFKHATHLPVYLCYAKYEFKRLFLFGVTPEGLSISLQVVGFRPCVYLRQSECPSEAEMHAILRKYNVESIEPVEMWIAPPAPVDGKTDVWKVTFGDWDSLKRAMKQVPAKNVQPGKHPFNFLQQEQMFCELLYMYDRKLTLHGWNLLDRSKCQEYSIGLQRLTTTALEWTCEMDALGPMPAGPYEMIPKQIIASIDIETVAEAGVQQFKTSKQVQVWIESQLLRVYLRGFLFSKPPSSEEEEQTRHDIADIIAEYALLDPNPNKPDLYMTPDAKKRNDPCISIVTHFLYMTTKEPVFSIRHGLGIASPLPGQSVSSKSLTVTFDSEAEMLKHWVHTVRHTMDCDLLSGHNFSFFDFPYLYDRGQVLDIGPEFDRLSRYTSMDIGLKAIEVLIDTKGRGMSLERRIIAPGLRQFDTLKAALQMYPCLPDHKLSTVAKELLEKKKDTDDDEEEDDEMQSENKNKKKIGKFKKKDLAYEALAPFWCTNPYTRWEILDYNERDVELVDDLIRKCGLLDFSIETSADTFTSLSDVVLRGQSIRCWQQEASELFEGGVLLDHNMRRRLVHLVRSKMTREDMEKFYDPDFAPDYGIDEPIPYQARLEVQKNGGKKKKKNKKEETKSYRGARLVELKRGFYDDPVLTLDFAGLYPSIAITFRLCFTRYLPHRDLYNHEALTSVKEQINKGFDPTMVVFPRLPEGARYHIWFWNELDLSKVQFKLDVAAVPDDMYIISVIGCGKERCCFIYEWPRTQKETPKPIVSDSCANAVKRRKITKGLMEAAKKRGDMLVFNKYNAQQLCFKCRANSLYGFHGAKGGVNDFFFISQAICLVGRILNMFTEETLKNRYHRECIYGDTDSVMPVYRNTTLEQAHDEGKEAAKYITSQLPGVLKLEFENVKCPSIFYTPKGYAYFLRWDGDGKLAKGKLKVQGLGNKRRNYCRWYQRTCDCILKGLLLPKYEGKRKEYILGAIQKAVTRLDKDQVPIHDLARTCKIKEQYDPDQNLAQKNLADRMKRRGQLVPGGTRITMVFVAGENKRYQRAEIPEYIISHRLRVDKKYYRDSLLNNIEKMLDFHPDILREFQQLRYNNSNILTNYFQSPCQPKLPVQQSKKEASKSETTTTTTTGKAKQTKLGFAIPKKQ